MKKIISILLACMLVFSLVAFAGCSKNEENADTDKLPSEIELETSNPVAVINVKDYGKIVVELYPDKAPNTVNNFISLAKKGFYNGLTFHRVIEDFMIQGGCPEGTGIGDPGYSIAGEFYVNGFENDLLHTRGVISMARGGYSYDSAGSQFFIMHKDAPHLDGKYASFGMVVEGIEVVDAIAVTTTGANDKPVNDIIIDSVVVYTNGKTYSEPETLK